MPKVPSPLYMLAFDHREVLRSLLGRSTEDVASQQARFEDGKTLVFEGLLEAVEREVPRDRTGILVDEEYGAATARKAKTAGLILAMPVEASRTQLLEFQYGSAFADHVEAFDPDIVKLLVFHNPDDSRERSGIQIERMREVSTWANENGYPLMLEILVRPTDAQLYAVGGSSDRFSAELHPELLTSSIAQLQHEGIEPSLWKVESLPTRESYESLAQQCRTDGRDNVRCIILGNGAEIGRVEQWLTEAANVAGFAGFAVGRSVWFEPLRGYYTNELTRSEAITGVADASIRLVKAFGAGDR